MTHPEDKPARELSAFADILDHWDRYENYSAEDALEAARTLLAASAPPAVPSEPLKLADVLKAIHAVDDEAARRGAMFPQTSDEQDKDRRAVRRVDGVLRWARKYVVRAATSYYDGTQGAAIRAEAHKCLAAIDAELLKRRKQN